MAAEELPTEEIEWIRMGTTVAPQMPCSKEGARCALLITRGFRDILKIGNQDRPKLFDLEIRKSELLYEEVVEVDERLRLLLDDEDPEILERSGYSVVTGITGAKRKIIMICLYVQVKRVEGLLDGYLTGT